MRKLQLNKFFAKELQINPKMGMLFTCYQYLLIAHSINVYAVVVKNGRDRISRSMGKTSLLMMASGKINTHKNVEAESASISDNFFFYFVALCCSFYWHRNYTHELQLKTRDLNNFLQLHTYLGSLTLCECFDASVICRLLRKWWWMKMLCCGFILVMIADFF